MKLYTFAISHFSEKARWALDLTGRHYEETLLWPGPHMLTTRRLASGTSVPILVCDDKVIQGSSQIFDYVGDQLGLPGFESARPQSHANLELERLFDEGFGRGVQRIVYGALLGPHRALITELWSYGSPRWVSMFYKLAYPGVARAVQRMYKTSDRAALERSVNAFGAAMDAADRRLAEQPYLDGEQPGRTDVTLAALLAPLVQPAEHPLELTATRALPAEVTPFITPYANRPAMAHVAKLYREHRFRGTRYRLGQGGAHQPIIFRTAAS